MMGSECQIELLRSDLELVRQGQMTLEQAAENADVSIYKAMDLARQMELILEPDENQIEYGLKSLTKKIKSSNF